MRARSSIALLSFTAFTVLSLSGYLLFSDKGAEKYDPRTAGSTDQQPPSGYKGALEYYKDLRAGATPEKVRRSRKAAEDFSSTKAGSLDLDWVQEGPVNQGGRTRSILIMKDDPDKMWVGSVSGGIWRSNDGGKKWESIPAFDEEVIVSDMAQLSNGDIYVATGCTFENTAGNGSSGFRGRGLFKTSDNGESFELVDGTRPDSTTSLNLNGWAFINEIGPDPTNENALWIARSDSGLTHYDASNNSFSLANGFIGGCADLSVSDDGSHVLASTEGGRIFRSTDGGNSFDAISGTGNGSLPDAGKRAEVVIAPSNKDYMYVSMAESNGRLQGIYFSKNGGDDWAEIAGQGSGSFKPFDNGLTFQGNYDNAISVKPNDPGTIVVGGITFWKWKNSPTSFNEFAGQWTKLATTNGYPASVPYYVHADIHEFAWRDSSTLYIGGDGGVFVSDDNLSTFLPSSKNFVSTQFYSVDFSPKGQILGGTQDNGTQYLNRSGRPNYADQVRGGDGFGCEVSQLDGSVLFATIYGNFSGGSGHYVQRSETGGEQISNFFTSQSPFTPVDDFYSNIRLFEDRNDTSSKDSVNYINTTGDTLLQGDSITYESMTLKKKVDAVLPVDSLMPQDTVRVQDPVQSLFAFTAVENTTNKRFVYLTRDALRLTKDQLAGRKVIELSGGQVVNTYAFSSDGNHLWVGMRNGEVIRASNLDSAYNKTQFNNEVTTKSFSSFGAICTDISVDPNDPDHAVISVGGYGSPNKVYQSFNATSSSPNWKSIWNTSNTNLTQGLAAMPVYDVLIERDDPNIIIAGTEHGVYASDDGGSTWAHQNGDALGHVPVFAIEQQRRDWGNGVKNPGYIYLGTHGKGLFKTDDLKDIRPNDQEGDEIKEVAKLGVRPNPASERAFLSFAGASAKDMRISVYDLQGQEVNDISSEQVQDSNSEIRLNVSDLKEGVYVVRARSADFDRTGKLVISR